MRDDCMREKEMSVRPPLVKEQLEPRASLLIPSSSVTAIRKQTMGNLEEFLDRKSG